jgi:hypothetical protein
MWFSSAEDLERGRVIIYESPTFREFMLNIIEKIAGQAGNLGTLE